MSRVMEQRKRVVNNRLRNRNRISSASIEVPKSEPPIEETTTDHYQYAGFWMRFWAFLLDLITVFSFNMLIVSPFIRITDISGILAIGPYSFETILWAVIFFLYFAIMTKNFGQTIGKMVMGVRVISKDRQELKWTQLIFREGVGRFLHQSLFFLYAIYAMVAFTEKKQGLHDVISDTYVIIDRNE
ncbi:RDD family protein [Halalkalibacter krulwichiae]|uniref:RDD family protein n=1 Tax=Halalkalibacter krulwichiae TaxID=199441 RepID=A0A1X9ME90_9BACI|nr:RDD family protein [Halalkalibacter krulwichiae]ARK31726.1 RDD family protein [Halalkalibacter krulwichiae]